MLSRRKCTTKSALKSCRFVASAALTCGAPLCLLACSYIAELKFDGERIQVHRDGDKARRERACAARLRS